MSNLTTKLMTSLLQGKPVDEFFRSELETAVNNLLAAELTSYLWRLWISYILSAELEKGYGSRNCNNFAERKQSRLLV